MASQGFGKASGPLISQKTQQPSSSSSLSFPSASPVPQPPSQIRHFFPSRTDAPSFEPSLPSSFSSSFPAQPIPPLQRHPTRPAPPSGHPFPNKTTSLPPPRSQAESLLHPSPARTTAFRHAADPYPPLPSYPSHNTTQAPLPYTSLPPTTPAANVSPPAPRSHSYSYNTLKNQATNGPSLPPRSLFAPNTNRPRYVIRSSPPISSHPPSKNQAMNGGPSPPRSPFPRNIQPQHLTRPPPPSESSLWHSPSSNPDPQSQLRWLAPEQRGHRSVTSSFLENGGSHFLEDKNGSSPLSQKQLSPLVLTGSQTFDKSLAVLHDDPTRSSASRLVNQRIPFVDHTSGPYQSTSHPAAAPHFVNERTSMPPPNPIGTHALKRNRSPPSIPLSERSENISESEREMQAKAKRLARFGAELNQPVPSVNKLENFPEQKQNRSPLNKRNLPGNESGKTTEESLGNIPDADGQVESSIVITGLCQDMCPASEREERERKGDLDQYERLDGDRNRTNSLLAVKKYNRMAERDALLIRPMPVLQKTVHYLLQLLDQPYSDKFLGIYNFLWDRMRSIRMDLRMQHLFNQEAITMLEQMIRLHIVAMHELCEYKKGEGFSEGFDAHLNIEQMNKTSVELFQLYDDHRKRGIDMPTEKEFRGYYALLKLDRHPGYKVEPAELSLDLAKMTSQIRGTPEILFARDVARACRVGNFVAFFRLARKATYLQACLMHAHFSKLRTLALASLHSGLQNNQGIPVEQVVKWLAMEGEDVKTLLEYHGFTIKEYQEPYMVKEGPFLNRDLDYPAKCSELVDNKKSARIFDDVSSSRAVSDTCWISASGFGNQHAYSATNTWQSDKESTHQTEGCSVSCKTDESLHDAAGLSGLPFMKDQTTYSPSGNSVVESQNADDEKMDDFRDACAAAGTDRIQPTFSKPSTSDHIMGLGYASNELYQNGEATFLQADSVSGHPPHEDVQPISYNEVKTLNVLTSIDRDERPVQVERMEQSASTYEMEVSTSQKEVFDQKDLHQKESEALSLAVKYEAAREKLKMIIRIWRQRASMKKETRERHQYLSSIAMNALTLGPPFYQNEVNAKTSGKLSMNIVIQTRDERREKSWSRLNVAKLVHPILDRKSLMPCHCWKLVICIQRGATEDKCDKLISTWLSSKLMGACNGVDDELVVSTSTLSIWKDVSNGGSHVPKSCCYCVVRKVLLDDTMGAALNEITVGADAILYLISEALPSEIQRAHICALLESIPHQASLSLLVLCHYECEETTSDLINRLGLDGDASISTVSVVSVSGEHTEKTSGFFSDDNLKRGLEWLAEQSLVMPTLRLVKTRNLVLNMLGSLQTVNSMRQSELDSSRYIAVFNEALDLSVKLVADAANMNVNYWPCPEIDLLESSFDRKVRDTLLPVTGWSSSTKTDPILGAIEKCKLPSLHCNNSWLGQGSRVKKEILDKKSNLEKCLYDYLTGSTEMMSGDLAVEEARIMVQKGAVLELRDSEYFIMPRWGLIFQRIYNWRLRTLTSKESFFAYIIDDSPLPPAELLSCNGMNTLCKSKSDPLENLELGGRLLTSILAEPSLDELIEGGFGISSGPQPAWVMPGLPSSQSENAQNGYVEHAKKDQPYLLGQSFVTEAVDSEIEFSKQTEVIPATLCKSDKLALLLEQCNMLQDRLDERLSLYF